MQYSPAFLHFPIRNLTNGVEQLSSTGRSSFFGVLLPLGSSHNLSATMRITHYMYLHHTTGMNWLTTWAVVSWRADISCFITLATKPTTRLHFVTI